MNPTATASQSTAHAPLSLLEIRALYKEKKYTDTLQHLEEMFKSDKQAQKDTELIRFYDRVKDKVDEQRTAAKIQAIKKQLGRYKHSPEEVRSIREALFWVNGFFKRREYEKAIRGCKEILAIDPDNARAKRILSQAEKKHVTRETAFKKEVITAKMAREEQEQVKMSEIEKLKFEMTNCLELEKFKKAGWLADKILELSPDDIDAVSVKNQLSRLAASQGRDIIGMKKVDFSSMRKILRRLSIVKIKLAKKFSVLLKLIMERLKETDDERLKRKALELIKEKKDNNLLAQKIQKNIIPQIDKYTLPGFDVWGDTLQSDAIGGDCFNFIQKDPENVLFYIGDASGHGIRASLFASRVNLILRESSKAGKGLRDTALYLNQSIMEAQDKDKDKDFMTMILFDWNLRTKQLKFVGAGHEYIIHYNHKDRKLELVPAKGIAIGMVENMEALLLEREMKLEDQDILILYSDGITEAELKGGKNEELFGIDRLTAVITASLKAKNSKEMYNMIIRQVGAQTIQHDDISLLVLRRDEKSDLIFEEDLKGIETIDLNTLKNLSRAEVEKSIQEITLEQRTKKLLVELKNMFQRGEYQLIINKCTTSIKQDKIYNHEVNAYLKKAKRLMIKDREHQRRSMIKTILQMAKEDFKSGEYLKAKMGLLKILKLEEKNGAIKQLFKKVERKILKEGTRRIKKVSRIQDILDNIVKQLNYLVSPVSRKDNIDFILKLSNLVNSGIKVKDALLILIKQTKKESLKLMYRKFIDNLERGFLLSFSMAAYPRVFTNLQVNLVRAGEESGNLGPILDDLSKQLIDDRDLRRKIIGALIYPLFIVGFSVLLVIGMLVFVVPQLAAAYADAHLSLPLPTLIIIGISQFIQNYWYVVLLVLIITVIMLLAFKKTLPGTLFFDDITLKIPVIRDLNRKQNIFLFANSLSMLLDSGLLLLDALSITSDVTKNIHYKREVIRMRNEIINGRTLSSVLGIESLLDKMKKENPYFPIEVAQMAQVGETTGQITKMLRGVGKNYQEELQAFAKNFSTIIEPFLIVFIGIMVGLLLIGIMLPFFEFGKVIKNM